MFSGRGCEGWARRGDQAKDWHSVESRPGIGTVLNPGQGLTSGVPALARL